MWRMHSGARVITDTNSVSGWKCADPALNKSTAAPTGTRDVRPYALRMLGVATVGAGEA